MKYITIVSVLFINFCYGSYTDSFVVDINDQSIRVTSPANKASAVSIIIKNHTFDKIVSELRSDTKVLKRFVLKAQGKEVLQVDFSKVKSLFYVPIAPPFEAVELRFKQRAYEIPQKK